MFHRGWAFRAYAPWDSIIAVEAAEMDGPLIHVIVIADGRSWVERTSKLWKQEELALTPSLAVRGRWLSVDPALLYHALRYYHAHAEARPEPASQAVAQLDVEVPEGMGRNGPGVVVRGLTASVGAAYHPVHGRSIDRLVLAADTACYAAKSAGRDRVHPAGPGDPVPPTSITLSTPRTAADDVPTTPSP